jgi:hypothetical protein
MISGFWLKMGHFQVKTGGKIGFFDKKVLESSKCAKVAVIDF